MMKFLICIFIFTFCLFTKAQSAGDPASLVELINKHTTKDYGIKPPASLIKAAKQGHSTAQLELAGVYFRKHSTFKNNKKASEEIEQSLYWFDKAANQGNAEAQVILGTIYCCSNDEDFRSEKGFFRKTLVHKNWGEAFNWFKKASAQGNLDAKYQLAHMHLSGIRVERDVKNAMYLLGLLSKDGNKKAQVDLNMAIIGNRHGAQSSLIRAFSSIEQLANEGNLDAQLALGILYISSEEIKILEALPQFPTHLFPVDYEKAVYWFKKAADQGSVSALLRLEKLEKANKVVLDPETKEQIKNIDNIKLFFDALKGDVR